MTKSFVRPNPASQTLKELPPSSRDEIRGMARAAGLDLPGKLMEELCDSYPAFEAMVRRLPRARPRSDEPAHVADVERLGSTPGHHSG
ncbi:MAG TPA: hypothetical protein VHP37_08580 [Burkholderiales bacterium]|nr:hypothetical protein [Burkholderiales bacterium]